MSRYHGERVMLEAPPDLVPQTIFPEQRLSPLPNLVAAVQHVVAMFGSTVLGPLLMGFDANTAIFFSGVATLIFYGFLRNKIPSYLGSSFSFIAAVNVATGYTAIASGPNPNIATALGGIIIAGLIYFLLGLIVHFKGTRWLEVLMPPVVTGAIVAIIGINLAPFAVRQISTSPTDTIFGLVTLFLVLCSAVLLRGFPARIPILIGGGLAYVAYYLACNVFGIGSPIDFSGVHNVSWVGIPPLTAPKFELTATLLMAPVALVLVAENFGHVRAIAAMTGRNLDPHLGRAFMADGISTMVSGSFGGTGVTTYAENIGVMSLTRNFSTWTLFVAGIIAMGLGLSPKFGEAIRTIPLPVLGGLAIVLFGLIAATAGRIWMDAKVDFTNPRNLLVVGVTLVMGAGDLTLKFGPIAFGGIATATFSALILYHVTSGVRSPSVAGRG